MGQEGGISQSPANENGNGDDGPGFQTDVLIVPFFAEKDIIIEMSELRGEIPQPVPTSSLYDFRHLDLLPKTMDEEGNHGYAFQRTHPRTIVRIPIEES